MPHIYRSFGTLMEDLVLPLREANPDWQQLNGSAEPTWEVIGRFEYDDRVWKVHADTWFQWLLVAYEAWREGNERPFVTAPINTGYRLDLQPSLIPVAQTVTHFYLYSQGAERFDPQLRNYWVLAANPGVYDISAAVREAEEDWWVVNSNQLKPGDRCAIWKLKGQEEHRGVVAVADVIGGIEQKDDASNRFWISAEQASAVRPRIPVRYSVPPGLPLWADEVEQLQEWSVYRARGGSLFRLSPEQWVNFTRSIGWPGQASDIVPIIESASRPHLRRAGQGFATSPEARSAVEIHAMELASDHLENEWEAVIDVSARESCDLLCQRGNERLYVEVKGTTGAGQSVLLTKNEVRLSDDKYPHTALIVVSGIQLDRENGALAATGGEVRKIRPWRAEDFRLTPLAYECRLPE